MSIYYTPPATVVDGDTVYAIHVNGINTETDIGFALAYADISAMEATVSQWATLAQKWAENPEDVEVTAGAYSAMHWALKSESFVSSASSYATQSQNYSIASADSASLAATKATAASSSASSASSSATNSSTYATAASLSADESEASAVRAESAAVDNTTDIADLTAIVSTNTDSIAQNTSDIDVLQTEMLVQQSSDMTGVSYTDPDAVGANPSAKIYPDGSICGSTDNGSYTKYPNGDLICSGTVIPTNSAALRLFPCEFSTAPYVTATVKQGTTSTMFIATIGSSTTTGFALNELYLQEGGSTTHYAAGNACYYIAIGRRKS